jgi:hypothetical protein
MEKKKVEPKKVKRKTADIPIPDSLKSKQTKEKVSVKKDISTSAKTEEKTERQDIHIIGESAANSVENKEPEKKVIKVKPSVNDLKRQKIQIKKILEDIEYGIKELTKKGEVDKNVEAPIVNGPAIIQHYLAAKKKRDENPKLKKKVAILGYAETTRMMAPFSDVEGFDIFGLNELYLLIPRADRWYEIHCPGGKLHNSRRNPRHREWLANCEIPIYMTQKIEEFPASVAYPIKEITALFGDYFTNSISYMICHALYEGYSEMHVYGVDMALSKEYREQKPSCEWFLGMAAILCDKLIIPTESDLLKADYLYGYEDSSPMARKMRDKIEELKRKKVNATQNLKEITSGIDKLDGAIQVTDYLLKMRLHPEE